MNMRILVDADGNGRTSTIIKVAKRFGVPVSLFCDCSRTLHSEYADIIYSDIRPESTDITLLNRCAKGDIVITNDIGLAGVALAKGAKVLHTSGRILNNRTIEMDMAYRAIKQKMRRNTKHLAQARKVRFGNEDGYHYDFYGSLVRLIKQNGAKTPKV